MKRSIQRLTKILPVPDTPVETAGDWEAVEHRLGTKLPKDYKDFISTYGTGRICDWLTILSPFARLKGTSLFGFGADIMEGYRELNLDPSVFPFKIYPENGGLIPWGVTDNGDEFFWRTGGAPNKWDVVAHDRGVIEFFLAEEMTFGQYLVALLGDDQNVPLASVVNLFTSSGITFEPCITE